MEIITMTCDRCGSRMTPGSDKFAPLFTCDYCGNIVMISDESSDVRAAQVQASVQQTAMDYQQQQYLHEAEWDRALMRVRVILIGVVSVVVSTLLALFLRQTI